MKKIYKALVIFLFIVPTMVFSTVPEQVNFQGMLEDSSGQPVTGNVDFIFSLYDSLENGLQLWAESQTAIPVNTGIYNVILGSVTPLTTDILDSASIYLEISVNGEILSPRQRLLAVPYALKALESENVGGVSNVFIQQLFQNVNYDGQSLANDDPLQGVVDTDADGLANFIDPDNDGDGINDDAEITNNTGVNLVTPIISAISGPTSVDGASAHAGVPSVVTITGTGFIAGLTVEIGTETPIAENLTSTSFDVTVGEGQGAGPASVTVTNPNGEMVTSSMNFYEHIAFITSGTRAGALNQKATTADAFCTQAALNAGLPGTFVAWYSDPDNSISAIDRFAANSGPWARLDGALIATDLADLSDGSIATGISIDEYGNSVNAEAATNTLYTGLYDPNSCFGNNTSTGYVGGSVYTDGNWTQRFFTGCFTAQRYYCFEQ